MTYGASKRELVFAATVATLLVAAWPASAQQQAPLPPGSPLIGRPDTEAVDRASNVLCTR